MRIRIGNWVFGINGNRTEHAIIGKFMFGKVAYTVGVVNKIPNMRQQMLFADFDTASLKDIFKDIAGWKARFDMGDMLLFQSGENEESHYFIISPCHYEPEEIRWILSEAGNVDDKFISSYIRYHDNTIRVIPKVQGKKEFRTIKFLLLISGNSNRPVVNGMIELLAGLYPNLNSRINPEDAGDIIDRLDKTTKDDLIIREYETIRW